MIGLAVGGGVAAAVAADPARVAEMALSWTQALIGLGSNLDNPTRQIAAAVAALRKMPQCRLVAVAPCYGSDPWGPPGQPRYRNTAALMETTLAPVDLLRALQALERQLGKVPPTERFGPRSIDLDLLTHGQAILDTPEITLPHPRLHERAFVLYPLRDIVPDVRIPGRGRVSDLAAAVDGTGTALEDSEQNL
jgi:2-amino-4-hydroxy-6-hydroxymethyldihydropteridine diphosphokinase